MDNLMLNDRTVTVTMKRIDLCNLLKACSSIEYLMRQSGEKATKWRALHEHLRDALETFDKEQGY